MKYLQGVIQNLTGIENANLDNWYPNTEKKFFAFIENKYKRENTLKVSGRKLCELLSINPNPLIDNEDLYVDKIDEAIDKAEYIHGSGLYDYRGMDDKSDSEWRFECEELELGGHL